MNQSLELFRNLDEIQLKYVHGNWRLEHLPDWLTNLFPPDDESDFSYLGNPYLALRCLATDQLSHPKDFQDLFLYFESPDRESLAMLVSGRRNHVNSETGEVKLILRLATELLSERRKALAIGTYHGLVGRSLPMLEVYHRIGIYGATDAPVIITGETGAGKELVARALHDRSPRAEGPFVPVNCAALPPDLFESELFGHEKGSFTGAIRQHKGRFERADQGTLFLDELGEMPLLTQSKLLRTLEEGIIERVGGEAPKKVDVRVIAATNVPVELAVRQGKFRPDLYYRLSVFRIHLPPLRDRLEDIPLLVESFLAEFNRRYQKHIKRLTPEANRILQSYHWPGNIRELRNVIERLVVESQGDAIGANALRNWEYERDFFMPGNWDVDSFYQQHREPIIPERAAHHHHHRPSHFGPPHPPSSLPQLGYSLIEPPPADLEARKPIKPKRRKLTEETIREAFHEFDGNATKAAESLGVHKATLYRHMKKFGLEREDLEPGENGETT